MRLPSAEVCTQGSRARRSRARRETHQRRTRGWRNSFPARGSVLGGATATPLPPEARPAKRTERQRGNHAGNADEHRMGEPRKRDLHREGVLGTPPMPSVHRRFLRTARPGGSCIVRRSSLKATPHPLFPQCLARQRPATVCATWCRSEGEADQRTVLHCEGTCYTNDALLLSRDSARVTATCAHRESTAQTRSAPPHLRRTACSSFSAVCLMRFARGKLRAVRTLDCQLGMKGAVGNNV